MNYMLQLLFQYLLFILIDMGMIFKAGRASLLVLCLFLAYTFYTKYEKVNAKLNDYEFKYHQQAITFNNIWNDNQFQELKNAYVSIPYNINQADLTITLISDHLNQGNSLKISLSDLDLQLQDIKHLTQISLLPSAGKHSLLSIQSKYYTILYNLEKNIICYQKIHLAYNQEVYYLDSRGRIWIVGFPNNNIVLARVYSTTERGLIWSGRIAVKEKVQMLSQIFQKDGKMKVKFLTFSRNYIIYQFDIQTFKIGAFQIITSHSFNNLVNSINNFQITLSNKIKQIQNYNNIQQFIFEMTFGHLGKKQKQRYERQNQQQYGFQALDCNKNIVLEFNNSYKKASLVGFDQVLVPLRTPVFVSKADQQKLLPFDQLLNRTKANQDLPYVDFKLYGIKNKNLQIMKGKSGLYRLLPDTSVHFMMFDNKYLNFYPKENVNENDLYIIRTAKGGIALKDNKITGFFQQMPVPNQNAVELKYGYSKQQIYHEMMTQGNQLAPGLYEAHIVQKGFFVKTYKNRLQLISNLNGKSAFTHYISRKQNYEYTTSFIQNNQFWVFQHKIGGNALITKYQLFLNSSSPKTLLSIKRNYQFDIKGKVLRVQKCIDYFYYFHYVTEDNRFGIARIHHALVSNRQALPDGNYAGAFEKMMVIQNIQRNDKIKVLPAEEQLLKAQFQIGQNIVRNWQQLQLKHQFRILPIRIFSHDNDYYIFNIRSLMLNAYDSEINKVSSQLYFKGLIVFSVVGAILAMFVLFSKKSQQQVPSEKQKDKVQTPTNEKQTNKKKKKE